MTKIYRTLADRLEFAHYQHADVSPPPHRPKTYWMSKTSAFGYDARTFNAESTMDGYTSQASNRAYERFKARLGDSSSFGATLTAELNQTVGLVTGTVLRCYAAAVRIKRLDFRGAASILGIPYRERTITKYRYLKVPGSRRRRIVSRRRVFTLPTGREVSKTLANGWLMWSYGVKPLAGDIYNALDVLQRPFQFKQRVRGSGVSDIYRYTDNYKQGSDWRTGYVRCSTGATVSVTNPNAYLLDKMGFTNPALWVLEAIPFSFVVDWFSNLSSVIGALSGYPGLTLEDQWSVFAYTWQGQSTTIFWDGSMETRSFDSFALRRKTDVVTPKLEFAYERFSSQRALNAISLLVGFLRK